MNYNTMDFIKKNIYSPYTILSLFLILFLVRVLFLDADPYFMKGLGDIGDEGYWTYNARNAALFNTWIIDDFNQALATAPLFSLMVFSSFKLLGVGYFQLRIVSALAGWLTLVILYVFVKDTWSKKAALFTLVILGFNSVFIMYNRLGMVESSMSFFLILTFYMWYKGNKNAIFYILSGICFSFAILTKITAFYFIPALIVLGIFEKVRKNLELKNIAYFVVSGAIPLLIYLIFLLIPYWTKLSPFLISVSGKQNLLTSITGPLSFIFVPFFGFFPIFLLLIPLILYLASLLLKIEDNRKGFINLKNNIFKMNYMEIVALSWIIGGSLGLSFSDLSERRFLIFFVPLSIIFTKVLIDKCEFDLYKIIWKLTSNITSANITMKTILTILVILPILSFIMSTGTYYHFLPNNSYDLLKILSLTGAICLFTFLFLTYINNYKSRYTFSVVILISFGCIISVPLIRLIEKLIFTFWGFTGIYINSMIILIVLLFLFIYLLFAFNWKKNLLKITYPSLKSIFIIYILFNFLIIGIQVSNPTFTAYENSKDLTNYLDKGDVITGPWSHDLSLENEMLPIWYLPEDPQFKTINPDISVYHPKYILIWKKFEGNKKADLKSPYVKLEEYPNSKFIKNMQLYPYPYTKNYRLVLYLYEIK